MANENQYRLGLALSGGGAKGIAHLGIFQAMEERGLKPGIISGTSAGALAGALYADGNKPQDILALFNNKRFKEFGGLSMPRGGLFKMTRFRAFLEKNLKARTFEELEIPLLIITTDIALGKTVVFSSGDLISAIVASCAVPIVFTPIEIEGKYYVDGGIFKNFPVSTIRNQCEYVIGVNVTPIVQQTYKNSIMYVAEQSFRFMSVANTLTDRRLCDVLIESKDVSKYSMFQLDNLDQIFKIGYDKAVEVFDEKAALVKTINSPELPQSSKMRKILNLFK